MVAPTELTKSINENTVILSSQEWIDMIDPLFTYWAEPNNKEFVYLNTRYVRDNNSTQES